MSTRVADGGDSGGSQGHPALRRSVVVLAVVVGAALGIAFLWVALGAALATDRGIEFSDEGLHLLNLDPPRGSVGFQYPYSWHVSPLFAWVGFDIAAIRTLGAVLLVLVSGSMGAGSAHVVASRIGLGQQSRTDRLLLPLAAGATSAIASLMLYSWFFRTPDYNWVNLMGAELAACGLLLLIADRGNPDRVLDKRAVAGIALIGFGAFYTLPARPSTWAAILIVAGVTLAFWRPGRAAVLLWSGALGALLVCGLAAVATGVWPEDVVSILRTAVGQPASQPGSTVSGAIVRELTVPVEFARNAWLLPREVKYGVLACLAAIVLIGVGRKSPGWALLPFSLAATLLLIPIQVVGPFDRLTATSTAFGLILAAAALIAVAEARHARRPLAAWLSSTAPVLVLALGLVVLALSFGFGSMAHPFTIAARASAILVTSAICLLLLSGATKWWYLGVIAVWTSVLTATTLANAWQNPLNLPAPIGQQVVATTVGPRGADLLVDPLTEARLRDITKAAEGGGWVEGTPLLGVAWQWSSTVPYHLGAQVPDFLMPGILYPNDSAMALLDYHVTQLDCEPWASAWILTSDPDALESQPGAWFDPTISQVRPWVHEAESTTTAHFGRTLADDYVMAASARGLQLWKPRTPTAATGAPCFR